MSEESIQSGSNLPDLVPNDQSESQLQEPIQQQPTSKDNTAEPLILNRTLGTSLLTQYTISSITKEVNGGSESPPDVELLSNDHKVDDIENSDSLFPSKKLVPKKNFTSMKNWAKNSKSDADVIEIDDNSKIKSIKKITQSNSISDNMRNPPESIEDNEGDRTGDIRPEISYEKPKLPKESKKDKKHSSESDSSSSDAKRKSKKGKGNKNTKKRSKGSSSDDDSDKAPKKKKKGSDDEKEKTSKKKKKASKKKKDESSEEEDDEEEKKSKKSKKKKSNKNEKKKTKGKKKKDESDDESQAEEASEDESDPEPEDGFEEIYGSGAENNYKDDDEAEFIDPGLPYQYCFRVLLKDHTRKPKDLEVPFEVPGEYMSPYRISRSELRMILIDRYKTEFPTIRIDSLEFCFLQELPCPLDTIDNDEDYFEEDIVEKKSKKPLKTERSEKKSKSKSKSD